MKKYSRREFFKKSATTTAKITTAALLLKAKQARAASDAVDQSVHQFTVEPSNLPFSREEHHPVVVVGTGFGGAVSALRLGEAGIKTLVLERGQEWPITDRHDTFPSFKKPDRRCRWLGHRPPLPLAPFRYFLRKHTGLLERIYGPDIDIVVGAGVGGASLTFGGVMAQPPREFFESVFPKEIPYSEMDSTYYPRVKKEIGFSAMPDDIYQSRNYKVARMFEGHAHATGFSTTRLQSVYDWDTVRKELDGTLPKSTVIGQYMYGVNSGAKLSVDRNYVKRAKETGNVEVRTRHMVQRIGQTTDGKYWLEVDRLSSRGKIIQRLRIITDKLILSSGSMWTSKLLVRARETKALPNLNQHIGQYWGNNAERVFLRMFLPETTLTEQGGPPSVGSMFQKTPHGNMSFEIAATAMPIELHTMCIAALGQLSGFGKFEYCSRTGNVDVHFPKTAYEDALNCAKKILNEWNSLTGGVLVDFDALGPRPVSYHPLGGAVLGKACDYYGRVDGYRGLYVIDSALVPGSAGCANPAWTIAALAERCIENIIEKDF